MNRIFLLSFALLFSLSKTFSQCSETTEPRILLVGDSWAWYMSTESTINYVLKRWGHSDYTFISNATLAVNGAQTDDVMKASCENEIRNQLLQHPTIDFVHLSIGGNDFLGSWDTTFTQAQRDTLAAQVFSRLDSIIRFIKSVRPSIKILWSGYCYTNFKEVILNYISPTSHPFYSTWSGMKFPDFIQINTLQNYFSQRIDDYCATHTNVYYVNANSLMQHMFGQPSPLQGGIQPQATYPALTAPIPLGYPNYPSPVASMRDYLLAKDCYHLSTDGYRYLIGYHTQKFYHKMLMDDLYVLSENNTQTGTVSSQGNIADTLVIGESGGEQFASVLSFNTTSMLDTTLVKANIFLRRKTLTGNNPLNGTISVKIKNGNFGTSADVEAADFNAADDANGTPCQFGSNAANGDWIRLDLPASFFPYIKNAAYTQFIISAPSSSGGLETFYNSTDPDFAPVLNLAYYKTSTGINEAKGDKTFSVYPNPTNGLLTIQTDGEPVTNMELTNILGSIVMQPKAQQKTIDISNLPSGIYILNITTLKGKMSQRVVKE